MQTTTTAGHPAPLTPEPPFALWMASHTMESTVAAMLSLWKGILAADESIPTIDKRFDPLKIALTPESRRAYREILISTPRLNEYISGVILFDETIRQPMNAQVSMPEFLSTQGIIAGIKVDLGKVALANSPRETITQGLEGLRERLIEYRGLGARFTKWRAVITIGENLPTMECIKANATVMASFALASQEAGLVPICEPEVLMDGNHSIERCEEVTRLVLHCMFDALFEKRVVLEQMILKTGMVLSGMDCPEQAGLEAVTASTLRCLKRSVPPAVPGVVFLSGGQSEELATQRLNAICKAGDAPWRLSFSFGRALQASAMKAWSGKAENIPAAQAKLQHRAKCNSLALRGEYSVAMESS